MATASSSVSQNRTVTAVEARRAVLRAFKVKRPVFLWGPMGIGKSELIADIATEMGGLTIDLRMATMEPTDLRGIPYFNKDTGTMSWAPPVELPSEELAAKYPIVVLFLDEMNSAAPAVQAAAYQLVLNRRVGTYKLPDNVVMVAAGNRETDKGVTYRMPAPLANRFVHLELRVDFESWLTWAVEHRINKDVVGFNTFSKQSLFDFDPRSPSRSFATPRSWTFVSELLDDVDGNESTTTDLVAGSIGEGLAVKFMAHRKIAGQLPNPTDILDGKVTDLKVKEISAMYSLVTSLCYELQDAHKKLAGDKTGKWHTMSDNFFRFMMDNFNTEIVVMGARVALTTYNLPFVPGKLKSFDEFHKRFGKYIIAASSN
jgi:hypothetical protein